ncbi:MAG: hypothetical protein KAK00_00445 [Nanoarchaeota archaeon]|nr:hypothetical protein [Nanoarchaeota archaeon]
MILCVIIWKGMEFDNNRSMARSLKRLAEEPKANPLVDRDIQCINRKIGG